MEPSVGNTGPSTSTSILTTTTNSITSPITTSNINPPLIPQTEVVVNENQTNWVNPDPITNPDLTNNKDPGETVAESATEVPSDVEKDEGEKESLKAGKIPPDSTESNSNEKPCDPTDEQSEKKDSPSLEEATASGDVIVKITPVTTTPSFLRPPDLSHLSKDKKSLLTRTRNHRQSLSLADIADDHKEKRATSLISKMTKIATSATYNKGAIQQNIFDMSNEAFAVSDLAESFTLIEDFDKRINAKKVKTVEKETLFWIYTTLKERVESSK